MTIGPIITPIGVSKVSTPVTVPGPPEVKIVSASSYTFLPQDAGKLLTFSNSSNQTAYLTPPSSSNEFYARWYVDVQCRGPGTLQIAVYPNTCTLDGATTPYILPPENGCRIYSDGSQYWLQSGKGTSTLESGYGAPSEAFGWIGLFYIDIKLIYFYFD